MGWLGRRQQELLTGNGKSLNKREYNGELDVIGISNEHGQPHREVLNTTATQTYCIHVQVSLAHGYQLMWWFNRRGYICCDIERNDGPY